MPLSSKGSSKRSSRPPSSVNGFSEPLTKWQNTDLQLYGSDLQTLVINSSAMVPDPFDKIQESRERFKIWRICKYRAVHWPVENYWHFYENDVYIVLQTSSIYASGTDPRHKIHLWIGKGASPDDYGTGAYKVAELDELLKFESIVFREIQGKESKLFKSYNNPIIIWKGSSDDNYFNKRRDAQPARLLRWYRPDRHSSHVRLKEVPTMKQCLRSENVMILDLGHQLYQWIGDDASIEDIKKSIKYLETVKANRGAKPQISQLTESDSSDHYFYFYLKDEYNRTTGGMTSMVDSDDETADNVSKRMGTLKIFKPILLTIQIHGDGIDFKKSKEGAGKINLKDITSQNIAVFDTGTECFVWIGESASVQEKQVGLEYAHEYLKRSVHPFIPVMLVKSRAIDIMESAVININGKV